MSETGQASGVLEPIALSPFCPDIPSAHRATGRVRGRRSIILPNQPLLHSPSSDQRPARTYLLDRVLVEQRKKNVALLLAFPLALAEDVPAREGPCWVVKGSRVVIKAVPRHSPKPDRLDDPVEELAAMSILSNPGHDHVVRLLDYFQDEHFVYLVLPYLKGGDLFTRVAHSEDRGLDERQAFHYLYQMAQGLLYMKRHGLAHHDVSLENVMLTAEGDGICKVIDTGMCLKVPAPMDGRGHTLVTSQACRGKPSYLSPEVVMEENFDPFAADMWSLGICLYTMLTGRPLYSSPKDRSFRMMARGGVTKVLDAYEAFGLRLSPGARDLVASMLHADPASRLTLEEVVAHPLVMASLQADDGGCTPTSLPSPLFMSPPEDASMDSRRHPHDSSSSKCSSTDSSSLRVQ